MNQRPIKRRGGIKEALEGKMYDELRGWRAVESEVEDAIQYGALSYSDCRFSS